jgi:hypothetical protein
LTTPRLALAVALSGISDNSVIFAQIKMSLC